MAKADRCELQGVVQVYINVDWENRKVYAGGEEMTEVDFNLYRIELEDWALERDRAARILKEQEEKAHVYSKLALKMARHRILEDDPVMVRRDDYANPSQL